MGEWKPIATAPKDGTPILIWQPDGGWFPNGKERHYECRGGSIDTSKYVEYDNHHFAIGYWRPWGGWGNRNSAYVNPTHWMPLPPPPCNEE